MRTEVGWLSHVAWIGLVAAGVICLYGWTIPRPEFGPEFCLFFFLNQDKSFGGILEEYLRLDNQWYRPSAFYLPYWAGMQLLSWTNIAGWKALHVMSLILACWSVYGLTLLVFPGRRLAGVLAALYLAAHPGVYTIILQTSAFDSFHIVLVILSVALFWEAHGTESQHALLLSVLGMTAYVAALTTKESTVTLPGFLAVLSLALIYSKRGWMARWVEARRQILFLLPYFVTAVLYLVFHLGAVQVFGSESAYRSGFNAIIIGENLLKYPLWMIRLYAGTGDRTFSVTGLDDPLTTFFSALFTLLTAAWWVLEWRANPDSRRRLFLLAGWIAIFLIVPVYSGGYLWHINLALCGYSALFGVAAAGFIEFWTRPAARGFAIAFLLIALGVAGIHAGRRTLEAGVHATAYKLNDARMLRSPPVSRERVAPNALIFVEDRLGNGSLVWEYGGNHLFQLAYLQPTITQRTVRALANIPTDQRVEWLRHPHAFFFRYTDDFRWTDASDEFRTHSIAALPEYLGRMRKEENWSSIVEAAEWILRSAGTPADFQVLDHYGYALLRLGRKEEAVSAFTRSIALRGDYYPALLNRGHALASLGRTDGACADFRQARRLAPQDSGIASSFAIFCR